MSKRNLFTTNGHLSPQFKDRRQNIIKSVENGDQLCHHLFYFLSFPCCSSCCGFLGKSLVHSFVSGISPRSAFTAASLSLDSSCSHFLCDAFDACSTSYLYAKYSSVVCLRLWSPSSGEDRRVKV